MQKKDLRGEASFEFSWGSINIYDSIFVWFCGTVNHLFMARFIFRIIAGIIWMYA